MWEGGHNGTKVAEEYCWAMAQALWLSWYVGASVTTELPSNWVSFVTACLNLVFATDLRHHGYCDLGRGMLSDFVLRPPALWSPFGVGRFFFPPLQKTDAYSPTVLELLSPRKP